MSVIDDTPTRPDEQITSLVIRDPASDVAVRVAWCDADDHGDAGWQVTAEVGPDRFTHPAVFRPELLADAKELGRGLLGLAVRMRVARQHAVEMESILRDALARWRPGDGAP